MAQEIPIESDLSLSEIAEKEEEVFPGVIERRYFIRSLVAAAALTTLAAATRGGLAQELTGRTNSVGTDKLLWDDFLKEAVAVGQRLVAGPAFAVDEYLYRIGSLATRLTEIPDTKLAPYAAVDPRVFFGPSFRGAPFFIIQWRMEPGAVLPPHNHPNASVCTLGFEGEVRLRNFEILGDSPDYTSKKILRIRETHNEVITRGRINTLSPSRDNIHSFQVGREGARGIDITTLHGKTAPFSFLDIAKEPSDAEKRIFEAAWSDLGRRTGQSGR